MKTIHFFLAFMTGYGLVVGVQVLDKRYLQTPDVRERGWNAATWGGAVLWLGELSLFGWCWVTRYRFDPLLRRVASPRLQRFVRGVLGLATGLLIVTFVVLLEGVMETYVFQGLLDLPPYRR